MQKFKAAGMRILHVAHPIADAAAAAAVIVKSSEPNYDSHSLGTYKKTIHLQYRNIGPFSTRKIEWIQKGKEKP
jgi:hypothetical protein